MTDALTPTPTPTTVNIRIVTREGIEAFTQRLVQKYAPEKVILFGSQARGDARLDSDADILVVMPYEGRAFAKTREIRRACKPGFRVDFCCGGLKRLSPITAGAIRSFARH
jgi:predicted nucleotidyltransferase